MRYTQNAGGGYPPPGMTNAGGTQGRSGPQNFSFGSNPYGQGAQQGFGQFQGGGSRPAPTQQEAPPAPLGVPNARPTPEAQQQFLPEVFKQPFMQGLEAAAATGSYAAQALPAAGNFQAGLYSPTMNPMEQQFMQSSGYLGSLGLEQTLNEIGQEYALDPYNMAKNKSYYDAANQFAGQMMQTGAQLGLDRMSLATQNLPNTFEFPNVAAGYGQQAAGGYYNALENARLGDSKFPFQFWSAYPIQGSTYVQPPAPAGGK